MLGFQYVSAVTTLAALESFSLEPMHLYPHLLAPLKLGCCLLEVIRNKKDHPTILEEVQAKRLLFESHGVSFMNHGKGLAYSRFGLEDP